MTHALTPRQRDVVRLIAVGRSCEQIGATLGISTHTVRRHLEAIAAKVPGTTTPYRRVMLAASTLLEEAA